MADLRQLYNLVFGGPVLHHGGEPSAAPGVSFIFLLDVTPPPPVEARGADLSAEIERAAEAAEVPVSSLQSLVNKAQHWQQFDSAVVAQMTKAKAESRTTKPPKPIESADLGDKILAIANGRRSAVQPTSRPAVRKRHKNITIELLQQYFGKYPLNEAANRLGVCEETLRRLCRKHQIPRWPRPPGKGPRREGLLQRLLEAIPDDLLGRALRPDLSTSSALQRLCDKYRVDKSGLQGDGVFEELQRVYNNL